METPPQLLNQTQKIRIQDASFIARAYPLIQNQRSIRISFCMVWGVFLLVGCADDSNLLDLELTSDEFVQAERLYSSHCAECHGSGVAGAPRLNDRAEWEERVNKGLDQLRANVINGMPPGMPARGLCVSCSDDDLRVITNYMLAHSL